MPIVESTTESVKPEEEKTQCIVPNWAIAMGHEEKYRRHHCGEN
jgi:hypothetical protein